MKVLLVYPNLADHPKDISFGLAAVSAMLKQAGHRVELLDATFGLKPSAVVDTVAAFRPGLVGITVASNDFSYAVGLAQAIRTLTPAPMIAGGFHATVAPEDILAHPCFDAVAIGEGDQALLEIAQSLEGGELDRGMAGVWFRSDGEIIHNRLRPLRQDVGSWPMPDRALFDYAKYVRHNRGLATFLATFGCPYPCTHCINHHLVRLFGPTGYVRAKPLDYLLAEIAAVVGQYPVRGLEFYDETFTLDHDRVLAFCEQYGRKVRLPFTVNARATRLDRELLRSLKAAGCTRVLIGIECGNPRLRHDLLKRPETDAEIIEAFAQARAAGLETHAYNMVGLPFETEEDIRRTIALNRRCRPDYLAVSLFNAYKGTDLHGLCAEKGWLTGAPAGNYFQQTNVRHPNFSPTRLKWLRDSLGFRVLWQRHPLRALIDLVDKKLLRFAPYHTLRCALIRWGAKRLLRLK
jgi:radical SAM superfamily enzyme YgiQ (UPF0313 family)